MPRIDSVSLVCRWLPDFVEVWVNGMCVFRAQGDNAGLAIAQRIRAYYGRKMATAAAILAAILLGLSSTAGATPLTITVAAGSDLPALGPCFADCHWEQVINPKVEPAVAQTAADWLADLLHEPAWIDFALWCPPITPPGLPPEPPPTSPPGTPRTPPGPPSVPPTEPPPTPPEPVGEAATGILLLVSLGALTLERRRTR